MHSRIYKGWVRHRRLAPTRNQLPLPHVHDVCRPRGAAAPVRPHPVLVGAAAARSPGSSAATTSGPRACRSTRRCAISSRRARRAARAADPAAHAPALFRLLHEPGELLLLLRRAGTRASRRSSRRSPTRLEGAAPIRAADVARTQAATAQAIRIRQGVSRVAVPADGHAISLGFSEPAERLVRSHAEFQRGASRVRCDAGPRERARHAPGAGAPLRRFR